MSYIKEIVQQYNTSLVNGLTNSEANQRLVKEGYNSLKEEKKQTFILTLLKQFNDPTIYLLLIAVALSLFLKEFIDAIIIIVVLIINSFVGAIQEYKAEKALDSLKKLSSPHAGVIRESKLYKVLASEIVLGDIIYLQEGDIVPSDILLFDINNLEVDESLLTGESLPVRKKYIDKDLSSLSLSLQDNMAFMSTRVIKGNAKGICIKRGMDSEVGKIANLIDDNKIKTPLQNRLVSLSKFLGVFTIIIVLLVLLYSLVMKKNLIESLVFAISLAVAAIPEGLPAVVTIVLSLGVFKLVKVNALVRTLPSVETLGSVDVVCSDKTGTLTKNKLSVEAIFYNGKNVKDISSTILEQAFVFNNNATLDQGDPLEMALNRYVDNYQEIKKKCQRIKEIPFSSEDKIMMVVCKIDNKRCLTSKGAYEEIIKRCNHIYINDNIEILTLKHRQLLELELEKMTSKALKVIAFSYSFEEKEKEQIFLGLVGLIDPPREGILESVNKLLSANIKPVMITGDHINTAYTIGKEIGFCQSKEECLDLSLHSSLDDIDIEKYKVFARVNPLHKVKIVEHYQFHNHVVAMTGDGVNDSPALKKADVGISMGLNGSDVSKVSSDIILQDDNFKTIERAIEEGRNVFINIKKAILFLLSSNLGEVIVILSFIFLNLPSPLISIHILWVNLISDSFPALALGSDKKYDDIMKDKPRSKNESLFANKGLFITLFYGVLIALLTSLAYLYIPLNTLHELDIKINLDSLNAILSNQDILIKSRTMAFCTLSISEVFHMIGMSNIKASVIKIFKNKNEVRDIALLLGGLLQYIVVEFDIMNKLFSTSSLELYQWGIVLLLSISPLVIHELLVKFYKRNL